MAVKLCGRKLLTENEKLAPGLKTILAPDISDINRSLSS